MNQPQLFTYESLSSKSITHQIAMLKPNQSNLELMFIILEKLRDRRTKTNVLITTYLVADSTGSVHCNFYEDFGAELQEGDIVYANGYTTNLYNSRLVLYQGKVSKSFIIGKFMLEYTTEPHMSAVETINID